MTEPEDFDDDEMEIVERSERTERRALEHGWDDEWRTRRPSIFFPLVLITLGVIFLLRNTGALPGNAWDTIIRLWPLIFVAIGVDSLLRGHGIAGPLLWVGLGIALLLANLDLLELNIWQLLFNLWPVFLIAIGLDIVIGRRSVVGAVIALVLLAAIVAGALWFMGSASAAEPAQTFSESLGGANQAQVSLSPAVGTLQVRSFTGGEAPADLITGNMRTAPGETVGRELVVEGGTAYLTVTSQGRNFMYPSTNRENWNWDVRLNPQVPIGLAADMGAGDINLELINLQITGLEVSQGVGRVHIVLPAEGGFQGSLSGAIGDMVIFVPRGVDVRIEADTALTWVDIPGSFQRQDNVYTTAGYTGTNVNAINLEVSQAIGKVTVILEE